MDRRPDAGPQVAPGRRAAGLLVERQGSPIAAMSSTGTTTWRSSGLRVPASTIVTSRPGPTPPRNRRDRLERPLRGGQPDPLHRPGVGVRARAQRLEALEAEGEVRAALRAGDRMDLVDDDVLDPAQDLAGGAGQHQVERLGRRDQDVGRVASDLPAIVRVALPDAPAPPARRCVASRSSSSTRSMRSPGQLASGAVARASGSAALRRRRSDARPMPWPVRHATALVMGRFLGESDRAGM